MAPVPREKLSLNHTEVATMCRSISVGDGNYILDSSKPATMQAKSWDLIRVVRKNVASDDTDASEMVKFN
jgi:hypothetical protein